jgi:hypothetical protein
MGTRKLLKQGTLLKAKSRRKLYAFLCSDILILTDESMKNLYRLVGCPSQLFHSLIMFFLLAYPHCLHPSQRTSVQRCSHVNIEIFVIELMKFSDETTFVLSQTYPQGGDSVAFRAPSARDCQRELFFPLFTSIKILTL